METLSRRAHERVMKASNDSEVENGSQHGLGKK